MRVTTILEFPARCFFFLSLSLIFIPLSRIVLWQYNKPTGIAINCKLKVTTDDHFAVIFMCTAGKGLGKSECGIPDPIRVKIKHDTAGVSLKWIL